MFCTNCGKKVEDTWKNCPYCGSDLTLDMLNERMDDSNTQRNVPLNRGTEDDVWQKIPSGAVQINPGQAKKKKKKWPWVLGICGGVVLLLFIILLLFSGGSARNPKAEKFVQDGTYGEYNSATVKEVLEYNWEDGVWDSFETQVSGKTFPLVEYAKDKSRDSVIQFIVNLEEEDFALTAMQIDGVELDEEDAYAAINEFYYNYYTDKLSMNDVDWSQYTNADIKTVLDENPGLIEVSEELETYKNIEQTVYIMGDNGKIVSILLTGTEESFPIFGGVTVGDSVNQVDEASLEKLGYFYISIEGDTGEIVYGKKDSKAGVSFLYDENGIIYSIGWLDYLLETINDEPEEGSESLSENLLEEDSSNSKDIDYAYIYGGYLDGVILEVADNGGDPDILSYAFYDIDQDGYLELIVEKGTCNADLVYQVYTTDGETSAFLGKIAAGDTGLYECRDAVVFYSDYCKMGYEVIKYVYISDGQLVEETLFEGENEEYGYIDGAAIEELQFPMDMRQLGDGLVW